MADNKVYTATEAAKLIGMNNVSSFARQFKKRFGYSIKDQLVKWLYPLKNGKNHNLDLMARF